MLRFLNLFSINSKKLLTFLKKSDIISKYQPWPVGQAAKTSPSHGENMGSIPVRVIKILVRKNGDFLFYHHEKIRYHIKEIFTL